MVGMLARNESARATGQVLALNVRVSATTTSLTSQRTKRRSSWFIVGLREHQCSRLYLAYGHQRSYFLRTRVRWVTILHSRAFFSICDLNKRILEGSLCYSKQKKQRRYDIGTSPLCCSLRSCQSLHAPPPPWLPQAYTSSDNALGCRARTHLQAGRPLQDPS